MIEQLITGRPCRIKRIFALGSLLGLALPIMAQYTPTADLFSVAWRGQQGNPAHFPSSHRWVLSFPGVQAGVRLSPFLWYKPRAFPIPNQAASPLARSIETLDTLNRVEGGTAWQTFGLGFRARRNLWLAVGHRVHARARIQFPASLARLLYRGNGPFVGQELSVALMPDALVYQEVFLQAGFSKSGKSKLAWGLRMRVLKGIADIRTRVGEAIFYTHPEDYQLSAKIHYEVEAAWRTRGRPFADLGLGLDFGLRHRSGRLAVSAALTDFGLISWSQSRLYRVQKSLAFAGLPLHGGGGTTAADFHLWTDSLQRMLSLPWRQQPKARYLPPRMMLGGSYGVAENNYLSGYFLLEEFAGVWSPLAGLAGIFQVRPWLDLGISLAVRPDRRPVLSQQVCLEVGRFQVFGSLENGLSFMSWVRRTRGGNFQVGLVYSPTADVRVRPR